MIIKGYKFVTENEVIEAQKKLNVHFGIPKKPTSVTRNYAPYHFASLNEPTFYYILHNESMEIVLREPEEFEVVQGQDI